MLGKTKGRLHFWEQRSNREPNKEGDEESEPRKVECSHVRAGKVAQLNLGGSIILKRIDGASIGLVWLRVFDLKKRMRTREERGEMMSDDVRIDG